MKWNLKQNPAAVNFNQGNLKVNYGLQSTIVLARAYCMSPCTSLEILRSTTSWKRLLRNPWDFSSCPLCGACSSGSFWVEAHITISTLQKKKSSFADCTICLGIGAWYCKPCDTYPCTEDRVCNVVTFFFLTPVSTYHSPFLTIYEWTEIVCRRLVVT